MYPSVAKISTCAEPSSERCVSRPRRATARKPARAPPLRPAAAQVQSASAPSTSTRIDVSLHVAGSGKKARAQSGSFSMLSEPPRVLCSPQTQVLTRTMRVPWIFAEFHFFGATDKPPTSLSRLRPSYADSRAGAATRTRRRGLDARSYSFSAPIYFYDPAAPLTHTAPRAARLADDS